MKQSKAQDIYPHRRDEARDLRACAWRFVFDCYEKKLQAKAAGMTSTNGGDGTKTKEDSADAILHDQRRI